MPSKRQLIKWVAFSGLSLFVGDSPALAGQLAAPKGDVALTVSGEISNVNAPGEARFDLDMLKALPRASFRTKTQWTTGISEFSGVSLVDLLAAVGAKGATLRATALNDYAVDIPVADAIVGGPIIAYALDGKPMSVRDKGPLWIIYPFDAKAEYRAEAIYSRSIWQLRSLVVHA